MNWKKTRRKARRFLRRNRRCLRLLAVFVFAMALICAAGGDEYDAFRDALAMRESSGDYSVVNRFGYLGRYQMGTLALQEAGFLDENGAWTALANEYGIASEADFLANPRGQDAAVTAYHQRTWYYIRALGLDAHVGSTYCDVKVTRSGLLAACHLVGVGGVQKGLATGQPVHDANGVSAAEYMELFAGYDISRIWQ